MRSRIVSVLLSALLLAATGGTQSCSGDSAGASLQIRNASDVALDIVPVDEPRASVRPSGSRSLSLGREAGDCTEWQVKALTEEGVVVATTGPPVCDGDVWEITQEDVDAAMAGD